MMTRLQAPIPDGDAADVSPAWSRPGMAYDHWKRSTLLFVLSAATLVGCDDTTAPPVDTREEVGVVVGSTDRTLTVFDPEGETDPVLIGLGPDGSPVSVAVRAGRAVVPMGVLPVAVVVDLEAMSVVHNIPLPENSGATGVAFLNDSIAIVGNPGRNTVTPVNVRQGTPLAEIAVGVYPQAATSVNDTVFVLNANLVDFAPAGPSSISVITGTPPQVTATIPLTATNANAAAAGPASRLYVVQAGSFGAGNGSLSIVDRLTRSEFQNVHGFGEFPGSVAVSADRQVYVGAFAYGLAVWSDASQTFLHPPETAIAPGGTASVSGVALDSQGRLWTLRPDCINPGSAYLLNASFQVEREITTGVCPIAIAFGR